MNMTPRQFLLAAALLALLPALAPGARAQQATSAVYEDWVLECRNAAEAAGPKTCQISQTSRVKETNQPFSRVLIAKTPSKHFVLVAQTPVNVATRAPVTLRLNNSDPGVSTTFDRCLPAGCFAEFELKDDLVQKLRAAKDAGKLVFKSASGQDVAIPISMKGFRQSLDALQKE